MGSAIGQARGIDLDTTSEQELEGVGGLGRERKGCDEIVHVTQGQKIPRCKCGATELEERRNEPGNASTSGSGMRSGEHRKPGS